MRTTLLGSLGTLAASGLLALAGCGGDDGDVTAFCDQSAELENAMSSLSGSLLSDPEAAQGALDDASSQIDDLAGDAPDEIKDDVETIASFFSDFTDQVADADSAEELTELAQEFQADAADVQEAGTNVEEFIAENCDESA